jgi:hypothetical protein
MMDYPSIFINCPVSYFLSEYTVWQRRKSDINCLQRYNSLPRDTKGQAFFVEKRPKSFLFYLNFVLIEVQRDAERFRNGTDLFKKYTFAFENPSAAISQKSVSGINISR